MMLPTKATMKDQKLTGMKGTLYVVAQKGAEVMIINVDHDPVYICENKKGETFSVNKENLTIK